MIKAKELADILQAMSEEDEDLFVKIEDKDGNVYHIEEVCLHDDGERYEIALRSHQQ